MNNFKDINRTDKYPVINNDDRRYSFHQEQPISLWQRIWAILICIALLICIGLLSVGCRSYYCPTYSSATYNAKQPGYPGKYNPVKH